jgi:hypothetical protein
MYPQILRRSNKFLTSISQKGLSIASSVLLPAPPPNMPQVSEDVTSTKTSRIKIVDTVALISANTGIMSPSDVCTGLGVLNDIDTINIPAEARDLLAAVAKKIAEIPASTLFDPSSLSMALRSLRRLFRIEPEVFYVCEALSPRIVSCVSTFSAQQVSDSLWGLKYCPIDTTDALHSPVNKLAQHTRACADDAFCPDALADALDGLSSSQSNGIGSEPVLSILEALAPKIAGCSIPFGPATWSRAVNGLRRCDGYSAEARAVFNALAFQLQRIGDAPFSAVELSKSFNGIKYFSSHDESRSTVLSMFGDLAPRIAASHDTFSSRCVGSIVSGLRGHCPEDSNVQAILASLALKMDTSSTFDLRDIRMAVYGDTSEYWSLPLRDVTIKAAVPVATVVESTCDISASPSLEARIHSASSSNSDIYNLALAVDTSLLPQESIFRSREGCAFIAALLPGLRDLSKNRIVRPSHIVICLRMLRGLPCVYPEVRQTLLVVVKLFDLCYNSFSAGSIIVVLNCLCSIQNPNAEVRAVFESLLRYLRRTRHAHIWSPKTVQQALEALEGCHTASLRNALQNRIQRLATFRATFQNDPAAASNTDSAQVLTSYAGIML